ncbi:MAG: hypothetical protein Q8Q38_00215, partial [bacterium]|nr:hypothetical protein [bacterium]
MKMKPTRYISLKEASRVCGYSQKYLNLRARQGKLKAEKVGRNWVTTKEWLDDYIRGVENFREAQSRSAVAANLPVQEAGVLLERERVSLPLKGALVLVVAAAIVFIGITSGEQGMQKGVAAVTEVLAQTERTGKQVVLGAQDLPEDLNKLSQNVGRGVKYAVESPSEFAYTYADWLARGATSLTKGIGKAYVQADQALSHGIRSDLSGIAAGYRSFNDTVDSLFTKASGFKFFAKGEPAGEQPPQQEEPLATPGEPAPEQGPTVIVQQPVREVVREVLDSSALEELRAQVADLLTLQGDLQSLRALAERIQSHPPDIVNPVAPVYIGSSGIQVGG